MRNRSEIVSIEKAMVDAMAFCYPRKSLEQHIGFALDNIEKRYYAETFGWRATSSTEPYDLIYDKKTYDIKLVTAKSLTIQNSEYIHGLEHDYVILLYIKDSLTQATFVGQIDFKDLYPFLQQSINPPPLGQERSWFCYLTDIIDLCK